MESRGNPREQDGSTTYTASTRSILRRQAPPYLVVLAFLAIAFWTDAGFRAVAQVVLPITLILALVGFSSARQTRITLGPQAISSGPKGKPIVVPFSSIQRIEARVSSGLLGGILGGPEWGTGQPLADAQASPRPARAVVAWLADGTKRTIPLAALSPEDNKEVLRQLAWRVPAARGLAVPAPGASQPSVPLPMGALAPGLGLGILAGLATSVAGVLAWAFLIKWTGLEIGILASVVGAACGYAVYRFSGKRRSVAGGIAAGVLGLATPVAGTFLGAGLFIQDLLAKDGLAFSWSLYAQDFVTYPMDYFGTLDLLFWALAVYAAWRIAGPRRDLAGPVLEPPASKGPV